MLASVWKKNEWGLEILKYGDSLAIKEVDEKKNTGLEGRILQTRGGNGKVNTKNCKGMDISEIYTSVVYMTCVCACVSVSHPRGPC